MVFADRVDAGRRLGQALMRFRDQDPVVLGLPRGGVVLAAEVARALGAPLDLISARKIGHPHSPEYAIGAVTEDGETVLNPAETAQVPKEWLETEICAQKEEAVRRRKLYGNDRPRVDVLGKTASVVDDGIATGYTVRAAVRSLKKRSPARIVVAAPVAAPRTAALLKEECDELVLLDTPDDFFAIGEFYEDFAPVSDRDLKAVMASFAGNSWTEETARSERESGEGSG